MKVLDCVRPIQYLVPMLNNLVYLLGEIFSCKWYMLGLFQFFNFHLKLLNLHLKNFIPYSFHLQLIYNTTLRNTTWFTTWEDSWQSYNFKNLFLLWFASWLAVWQGNASRDTELVLNYCSNSFSSSWWTSKNFTSLEDSPFVGAPLN